MTNTRSHRIGNDFYLIEQKLPEHYLPVKSAVNHIIVIDRSGSMAPDLPMIRRQLKGKLPQLVSEGDTVSIVVFSGYNQCVIVCQGAVLSNLNDLKLMNQAIDQWVTPLGLTGFVEPLQAVVQIKERVQSATGNPAFSLFFMTDGCDNLSTRAEILAAAEQLEMTSSTFVEYGPYADTRLIAKMAAITAGSHIQADGFDDYDPEFERAITKEVTGVPRQVVPIYDILIGDLVYALDEDSIITIMPQFDDTVLAPGHIKSVYYLTSKPASLGQQMGDIESPLYAAASIFAPRMAPDIIWPILNELMDVRFTKQFSTCFTKENYSDFQKMAKLAAFVGSERGVEGYSSDLIPQSNAFTLIDFLALLTPEDKVLINSPHFQYKRISRKRVDANTTLTKHEIERIKELAAAVDTDPAAIDELKRVIADAAGKKALKFTPDPAPDGYSVDIDYNSSRPNILMGIRIPGTVDLYDINMWASIPLVFPTSIYRKFPLINDGMTNIATLPMNLCRDTHGAIVRLVNDAVLPPDFITDSLDGYMLIHLDKLPLVNRAMAERPSAKTLFQREYELVQLKSVQKIYNYYMNTHFPVKGETFKARYGEEQAVWLKEQGITESGFNPKSESVTSTDFYMGRALELKLEAKSDRSGKVVKIDVNGTTVVEAFAQMAANKYTPAGRMMATAIADVTAFLGSNIYLNAPNKDDLFKTWLAGKTKTTTASVRKLMQELAKIKLVILATQSWFVEFASVDDNTLTIQVNGEDVVGTAVLKEVKVNI